MSAPSYTPQLRPLSVGEILDAGFRLLRARFGTLLLCVLVPVVPLSILATVVTASFVDGAFDPDGTATTDADGGLVAAGVIIGLLLQGAVLALAVGAAFKAVSAAYLGERAGVKESLRFALGRVLPLILAFFVMLIGLTLGFIALIVPGIFLTVRWSMAFAAIVFERKGAFGGIGRSWQLTRGHFWRTFGTLLIVFLIVLVVSLVLQGIVTAVLLAADDSSEVLTAIVATLADILSTAITYPLWAAVLTVMYYDLRVRNEGFDLQLLAQGVGADASRHGAAQEQPGSAPPPPGGFAPPQGPPASA